MTPNADKVTGSEPSLGSGEAPEIVSGDEPSLPAEFEVLKTLLAGELAELPETHPTVGRVWVSVPIGPDQSSAENILRSRNESRERVAGYAKSVQRRTSQALPALLALCTSDNPLIGRAAIRVLGEIGDPEAIPTLITCLQDPDENTQAAAATALYKIGSAAEPALLPLLFHSNPNVQENTAMLLGYLQSAAAVPHLARLVESDAKTRVLQSAAWALGRIGGEATLSALEGLLDRSEYGIRKSVLKAITRMGTPEAIDTLKRIIEAGSPNLRRLGLVYLGKTRQPEALIILRERLNSVDSWDREAAIQGLVEFRDPALIADIESMLQDVEGNVRGTANEAIRYLNGPRQFEPRIGRRHR